MKRSPLQTYLEMGERHSTTSLVTPMRADVAALSDAEKIALIEKNFREIMLTLGLDLEDDSLAGTPYRVAKMYVQEIFAGLDPKNLPKATLFENNYRYGEMLVEKNITLHSTCEHHFVPIIGRAHVAYYSSGHVIGLSKINRIVKHFASRPQVQERLTVQIAKHLSKVLRTDDVAVLIDAKHYCVAMRGVQDDASSTVTATYGGKFELPAMRDEFLKYITL